MNELDDSLLLVASCKILLYDFREVVIDCNTFTYYFIPKIILMVLLFNLGDGNVRLWKDYTLKSKQRLVTAFSSIQGHRSGVRSMNAVVDWQQQSGYLVQSKDLE